MSKKREAVHNWRSGALSVECAPTTCEGAAGTACAERATGRIGGLESTRTTESAPACRSSRRRDDRHDTKVTQESHVTHRFASDIFPFATLSNAQTCSARRAGYLGTREPPRAHGSGRLTTVQVRVSSGHPRAAWGYPATPWCQALPWLDAPPTRLPRACGAPRTGHPAHPSRRSGGAARRR